jgi:hypothetical protein
VIVPVSLAGLDALVILLSGRPWCAMARAPSSLPATPPRRVGPSLAAAGWRGVSVSPSTPPSDTPGGRDASAGVEGHGPEVVP